MNETKAYCSICGADITRSMKFYDNMANRYCYDCYQAMKARKEPIERKKITGEQLINRQIKTLYRRGRKPSEIAKSLNVSKKKIYEVLDE